MNNFFKTLRSNLKTRRAGLTAAVLLGLIVLTYLLWAGGQKTENEILTAPVKRGPLTITLEESGTIQNSQSAVVRSQVEGNTTILYLVPEGTQVKTGELLVELDSSQLVENLARQQITVMNAEASFIRARENLAVVRNQGESDIAKAELAHQFAVHDLRKYQEGEHPRELQKAEAEINIAREELQRANDKLEWSERLGEEGYVTRTELQADALSAKRAQINLALAESAMDLLINYSNRRNWKRSRTRSPNAASMPPWTAWWSMPPPAAAAPVPGNRWKKASRSANARI
ncbi:MAG: hypothetical protein LC725_04410 [Lentisphaerae bacterium]|nr:hypothetical protein [Lentisphaerota bacterium]